MMKRTTSVFVISMIAVLLTGAARADIADSNFVADYVAEQIEDKADKSEVYTKDEVDAALLSKARASELTTEVSARSTADTTLQRNIDTKQDKLKTGDAGNIEGTGSVTVTVSEAGKVTINGTDNNTVTTATTTGTGNVVSAISATNGALTVTKGVNAVTRASAAAVGDSTHAVYVDANGAVQKVDKVAAAAAADTATTATTATNAKKICHTSSCTDYVDIWVE